MCRGNFFPIVGRVKSREFSVKMPSPRSITITRRDTPFQLRRVAKEWVPFLPLSWEFLRPKNVLWQKPFHLLKLAFRIVNGNFKALKNGILLP